MPEHGVVRTLKVWGRTQTSLWHPKITRTRRALFVPEGRLPFGLYDENGQMVPASASYHGPEKHAVYPAEPMLQMELSLAETQYQAGSYLYCGLVLPHFGHTLLSTLSRYWFLAKGKRPADKILYHGVHPFSLPFLAFWLTHCGLSETDFVSFDAPTRLDEVWAVGASFEELWCAHHVFAELCQFIARNAGAVHKRDASLPPVYLSKSKVRSGIGKFVNEDVLEAEMAHLGARIVYPELLSLPEQIRLFHETPLILGTTGSAIHTSLFVKGGAKITALTYQDVIHGNNILIDKIAGNRSVYLTPPIEPTDNEEGFQLAFRLLDVKSTARGLFDWGQSLL